jgi:hypothetical protein
VRWQGVMSWLRHEPDQTIGIISGGFAIILAVLADAGFTSIAWVLTATAVTLIMLLAGNVRARLSARSTGEALPRLTRALEDLSLAVRHISERAVYRDQDTPYEQVREYVRQHDVHKAVFLQYSGDACAREIEAVLLKGGAEVTVYLQDEQTASRLGSNFQAKRIASSIERLRGWRQKYDGISDLTVYQCDVPMSVRAIMIDDRLLCMGWYTYEPDSKKHPGDTIEVSGHDVATVIAYRGTENFDALKKTFSDLLEKYERARHQVQL